MQSIAAAARFVTGGRRSSALIAGALAAALVGIAPAPAGAATLLQGFFRGSALGTDANAQTGSAGTFISETAFVGCPCLGTNGQTLTVSSGPLSAGSGGNVLKAADARSTAVAQRTASAATATLTDTVTNPSLLGGLITATEIDAVAKVAADATTVATSTAGSTFKGLKVAGSVINPNVAPNTSLPLPGVGTVVLKAVATTGDGRGSRVTSVDMLTVRVTQTNSFGLAVGSVILVGHATAGFSRTTSAITIAGMADATFTRKAAGDVAVTAPVSFSCDGTGGATRTNQAASLASGGVFSSGSGKTSAFGGQTASGTVARTTASVQNLSMLGGLIRATNVTAVAQMVANSGTFASSTAGSGFTGLKVGGVGVPVSTPPNTKLLLPRLGYVIVNEQQKPAAGKPGAVTVSGLHVVVTKVNTLGLAVGTETRVAYAAASAAPSQ